MSGEVALRNGEPLSSHPQAIFFRSGERRAIGFLFLRRFLWPSFHRVYNAWFTSVRKGLDILAKDMFLKSGTQGHPSQEHVFAFSSEKTTSLFDAF